jgi:AraC-like DNA-binding protein
MTAPANVLTSAATQSRHSGAVEKPAESTVLVALTVAVIEAAESLGLDGDLLRTAVGLGRTPADPDARVPRSAHVRLWEVIAARPVGLEIGARLGLMGLGVIGYAMRHGATAGEALRWLQRYRAVVHPDAVPRMERREEGRVAFVQVMPPPFARLREPVDCQAAATVAAIRTLTGTAVRPVAVALQHAQPADPTRHEAHFRCPITWGAAELEVVFDAGLLEVPLPRSETHLFGYLARRAEELLTALPAAASFAERTRREIGALLAEGEPALAEVARRMAVSARTLHRRLGEEGTGFAALVEEARRERAFLLLSDRGLSASEIAFLLGYAEPAVFFRAFRRWTGKTPQEWRQRDGAQAPPATCP